MPNKERQLENSTNGMLDDDVSTGNIRPKVTTTFRDLIFRKFHIFSHDGAKATIELIIERYVFGGMRAYIRKIIDSVQLVKI